MPINTSIFTSGVPAIKKFNGRKGNYKVWYEQVKKVAFENLVSYMVDDVINKPNEMSVDRWAYVTSEWINWILSTL